MIISYKSLLTVFAVSSMVLSVAAPRAALADDQNANADVKVVPDLRGGPGGGGFGGGGFGGGGRPAPAPAPAPEPQRGGGGFGGGGFGGGGRPAPAPAPAPEPQRGGGGFGGGGFGGGGRPAPAPAPVPRPGGGGFGGGGHIDPAPVRPLPGPGGGGGFHPGPIGPAPIHNPGPIGPVHGGPGPGPIRNPGPGPGPIHGAPGPIGPIHGGPGPIGPVHGGPGPGPIGPVHGGPGPGPIGPVHGVPGPVGPGPGHGFPGRGQPVPPGDRDGREGRGNDQAGIDWRNQINQRRGGVTQWRNQNQGEFDRIRDGLRGERTSFDNRWHFNFNRDPRIHTDVFWATRYNLWLEDCVDPQIYFGAPIAWYLPMPSIDTWDYESLQTVASDIEVLTEQIYDQMDAASAVTPNRVYVARLMNTLAELSDASADYSDAVLNGSDYTDSLNDLFYLDSSLSTVETTLSGYSEEQVVDNEVKTLRYYVNQLLWQYHENY